MPPFRMVSEFSPAGDQPRAIAELTESIMAGNRYQTLLGVTGSVAAYKAVDLASKLTQAGAIVDVIMTESAKRFVSAITFEAVTGRPVFDDLWRSTSGELPTHVAHIGLGEHAELLVVAASPSPKSHW